MKINVVLLNAPHTYVINNADIVGYTNCTMRILKNFQAFSMRKNVPFPSFKKESATPILWKYREFLTWGMFMKTHERSNFTRIIVLRNYFKERLRNKTLYILYTSCSLCLRMFRVAIDQYTPPRTLCVSWCAVASFLLFFIPL